MCDERGDAQRRDRGDGGLPPARRARATRCSPARRGFCSRGSRARSRTGSWSASRGRSVTRAGAQAGRRPRPDGRARGRDRRAHASVTVAYVGLGANLGPREETLLRGRRPARGGRRRRGARALPAPRDRSRRRHRPAAVPERRRGARDELSARALLESLLVDRAAAGAGAGRQRWGPRSVDLDLLVYGDEVVDEPGAARAASASPGAPFRAGAARRAGSGARVPGAGGVSDLLAALD